MSGDFEKNSYDLRPLRGRRVVVTRPRGQSEEITSLLENLGAIVIHCPMIEIREPDSWDDLDRSIAHLEGYDCIVFTSANGAHFFFRRLTEKRTDALSALERICICSIGPVTARAVEAAGARVDLVAGESKAEGALAAIIERLGGEQQVRGLRFLIPRAKVARELLPAKLAELGATVDVVEAYRTVKPNPDGFTIGDLFKQGAIDAITFTSPSTVANFADLTGGEPLSGLLAGVTIACIGPVTAARAREYGLTDVLQPETYTAASLVESLARAIKIRSQKPEAGSEE
jgi:uroporphyrinogen III methyltransferase/synthase